MKLAGVFCACFASYLFESRQIRQASTVGCHAVDLSTYLLVCLTPTASWKCFLTQWRLYRHISNPTIFLHPSFIASAPVRSSYQCQKPAVHPSKQLGYLRKNWVMVKQVKLAMGSWSLLAFPITIDKPRGLKASSGWLWNLTVFHIGLDFVHFSWLAMTWKAFEKKTRLPQMQAYCKHYFKIF